MDLYGRPLVDIAMELIIGYLFCSQASTKVEMEVPVYADGGRSEGGITSMKDRKKMVAKRYITRNSAKIKERAEIICAGDTSTFNEYAALVGPVPIEQ
jgi:hypothetical protein